MNQGLYNMGMRRFLVHSLGPLGCTPNQLPTGGSAQNCNDRVNQMVMLFNSALRSLIIDLNLHLPSSALSYADVYGMVSDVLINPTSYGNNTILYYSYYFYSILFIPYCYIYMTTICFIITTMPNMDDACRFLSNITRVLWCGEWEGAMELHSWCYTLH